MWLLFFVVTVLTMSWKQNPSSSSKSTQTSGLKSKEQQPKVYVNMRDERFAEKKRLNDGLPPVEKMQPKQQYGTKQTMDSIKEPKKK